MFRTPRKPHASDLHPAEFSPLAHPRTGRLLAAMGEGMSIQGTKDGRPIMWLALVERAEEFYRPRCPDPRKPEDRACRPDRTAGAPSRAQLRWRLSAHIMAVAYQTQKVGQKPAGFELFDISVLENCGRSLTFDLLRSASTRARTPLWFSPTANTSRLESRAGLRPRRIRSDDQCDARSSMCAIHRSRSRRRTLVDAGHAQRR